MTKERTKQRLIGVPLAISLLLVVDQWVKFWTVTNVSLNEVVEFIPHVLSLSYLRNYGAAFSILQNQQWFFLIVTVVVLVGAAGYLVRHFQDSLWLIASLTLVIAGGLGNFIDRLRLGYVVDMFHLDFIDFPVFNVADVCLTVGVAVLFIWMLKEEKHGNEN